MIENLYLVVAEDVATVGPLLVSGSGARLATFQRRSQRLDAPLDRLELFGRQSFLPGGRRQTGLRAQDVAIHQRLDDIAQADVDEPHGRFFRLCRRQTIYQPS